MKEFSRYGPAAAAAAAAANAAKATPQVPVARASRDVGAGEAPWMGAAFASREPVGLKSLRDMTL